MNEEDGITAVKLARCIITQEVTGQRLAYMMHIKHNEPSGVFVTINTYPTLALRGCIGFTEPHYPFTEALEYAARSACHDPRFCDLEEYELSEIVVEVTVLTRPRPIAVKNKEDLLKEIKIGRDGLMIEYRGRKGVFLPQVPVEWKWDVKEYLENLCQKAGIGRDRWKEKDCTILAFQGRLFRETEPNGDVTEVVEC
jgi:uncharacterized protein (TIGR00296 family)